MYSYCRVRIQVDVGRRFLVLIIDWVNLEFDFRLSYFRIEFIWIQVSTEDTKCLAIGL